MFLPLQKQISKERNANTSTNSSRNQNCEIILVFSSIKSTDPVSTMICYRCGVIAVELQKYRIAAIANDKILKRKFGQPYKPPIVDPLQLKTVLLKYDNLKYEVKSKNSSNNFWQSDKNADSFQVQASNTSLLTKQHPSVKKLLSDYRNIILPVEVLCDDISPTVTIDTTDVAEWNSKQLQHSENKSDDTGCRLISSAVSDYSDISSETDSAKIHLRKRPYVIDSKECIAKKKPKTLSSSDHITNKIKIPAQNAKFHASCENINTSPTTTRTLPLSATELSDLLTEFYKYGIKVENSEPPVEFCDDENPITCGADDDVICVTDNQAACNSIPQTNHFLPPIDFQVKSLFEKHFRDKPKAIYFHPNGITIFHNMESDLEKHSIPIQIQYSKTYQVKVVKNSDYTPTNYSSFWSYRDCTNIKKPSGLVVNRNPVSEDTLYGSLDTSARRQELARFVKQPLPIFTQSPSLSGDFNSIRNTRVSDNSFLLKSLLSTSPSLPKHVLENSIVNGIPQYQSNSTWYSTQYTIPKTPIAKTVPIGYARSTDNNYRDFSNLQPSVREANHM